MLQGSAMHNYSKQSYRYCLLALLSSLPWGIVNAGGLLQYEIGTPDLGLASAGYAARAQDAATAVTNPAGMTRLCDTEIMLGVQPLYGSLTFSPNSNTSVNGNDGGNAVSWFPGGGLYYVYNASDDFKLGISGYGNFGLPLHYNGDWVGRYYVTEGTLLGMTVAPSLAYRIHDMWSLGISFNAMYGILSNKAAVDNSPLGLFRDASDGELKIKSTTWGYGVTFGFLFEPTDCTRFGLTYATEIKLDFEDAIEFVNTFPVIIPGGSFDLPLDLQVNVPRQVMASFYHAFNDKWAALGNLGWQNWEKFGKIEISVDTPNPRTLSTDLTYKDTWHAALGVQYELCEVIRLSSGIAYDTDMLNTSNRSVSLPIGPAWRFAVGGQYFTSESLTLSAGYTFLWSGDLDVIQSRGVLAGTVAGTYDNALINYFGVNFDWKFL